MKWVKAVLTVLSVASCRDHDSIPASSAVRYVVGPAWQSSDGAWFYPQERFAGSWSGLSEVMVCANGSRAADGEACDPTLPEAAVQSLQLPVILRVTNLENGRTVLVRAIDRGPSSPGRVIGLGERSRRLLAIGDVGPARVLFDIEPVLSQQAAQDAVGGPRLAVSAAPETAVEEQPLGSVQPSDTNRVSAAPRQDAQSPAESVDVDATLRSQSIGQDPVRQTALWIDAGHFSTQGAARAVADAIGGAVISDGTGSRAFFEVTSGPYQTSADADGALNRARAGGIIGSRIVVR